jgi:MOSC domain-containing protein YiiM
METMRIKSINLGSAETIRYGKRSITTGINKRPVADGAYVSATGLKNDIICDSEHHGGVDQAVYVYSASDYDWWSAELNRRIAPGTFGENLTIRGLPHDMKTGDRLLIGDVILEATAPRIPCNTLAAAMSDSSFGLQFRRAERPGFYFRVLNEGNVSIGDSVTLAENPHDCVSMLDVFRLYYELKPCAKQLTKALESPIAERIRARFESKLGNDPR